MRHQKARHSGTDNDHRVGSFLGIRHRTRSFIAPAIAVISNVVADDGDIVFAHRRAGKEVDHLPQARCCRDARARANRHYARLLSPPARVRAFRLPARAEYCRYRRCCGLDPAHIVEAAGHVDNQAQELNQPDILDDMREESIVCCDLLVSLIGKAHLFFLPQLVESIAVQEAPIIKTMPGPAEKS